ncbi:MAG TPA: hypothetical protein VD902_07020 [Symbiobacteriaceae bacterium]|nr:hypothetical protein [Symbiobacteriaceae bacterium]
MRYDIPGLRGLTACVELWSGERTAAEVQVEPAGPGSVIRLAYTNHGAAPVRVRRLYSLIFEAGSRLDLAEGEGPWAVWKQGWRS